MRGLRLRETAYRIYQTRLWQQPARHLPLLHAKEAAGNHSQPHRRQRTAV
ncbi:hypothetical protein GCM10010911_37010 [Paenibacillus nasutitermitis]|uniref:Uncharacterized protein n=1 Tax=Paenibacillus nasutitermitis TaxID=1652958 RepID=A0A916Z4J7_9BACL|nr:hypothetical protein GCM10010911_37010 [Paenibacillus nasutitermitis]